MGHGLGQRVELEIVQLLPGYHRDRLGCFLDREVQARGCTHAPGSVGATVLSGTTQAGSDHISGTKLQHTVLGFGFCLGQRQRAEDGSTQAESECHGRVDRRGHRGLTPCS
ncbi:hypothetical protein D3C80_970420 [compost metagenome]